MSKFTRSFLNSLDATKYQEYVFDKFIEYASYHGIKLGFHKGQYTIEVTKALDSEITYYATAEQALTAFKELF